jgi:uncharacterized protein (TIGR00269 family)
MMKCVTCGETAVYHRLYSGEKLCGDCFTQSIENKVRETITRHRLLLHDERIAVALSGGKDSSSLLKILVKLERRFPRTNLVAITVDEGIKGYREESIEIAQRCCSDLGVEHILVSFKDLYGYTLDEIVEKFREKGEGSAPCSYCGVLRRKALNKTAKTLGAEKLATAHSLDDEVQTILLNIIHGDISRLSRITSVVENRCNGLIPRVKPFREVPEEEIALYAYLKRLVLQQTPCPYSHESMRNDARAMVNMAERRHPGTRFTILRSFEKLHASLPRTKTSVKYCKGCGEPSVSVLCKPCQILKDFKNT